MKKRIEIEFRTIFNKNKHNELKRFLDNYSTNLGKDDKDVYFFICKDKLLKVVKNISKKNAKIVLKLNRIGRGNDFEEIEISINYTDTNKAVIFFANLNITKDIWHSFQKRNNYFYKGVEIALKYSNTWGYHAELEIIIDNKNKKENAENKIKKVAEELNLKLMSDEELKKFMRKVKKDYKNKLNAINNIFSKEFKITK